MQKSIYLHGGGTLSRQQNTLQFDNQNHRPRFIPVEHIADIHALGTVTVNSHVLTFLSERNIPLHIYSYYGHYAGSYLPKQHRSSGTLMLAQARHYEDISQRLYLAKQFVHGSLDNIAVVLKYYNRRQRQFTSAIERITSLREAIMRQRDSNALMALEGNARNHYYHQWEQIVTSKDFAFEKRSRRPPQNPLNALISFANTLLYTTCLSELNVVQLDPRIGYLHATNTRNYTLNLDIAEVFKPIIVDRMIFTLLNKGMLQHGHFHPQAKGIYLNEEGRKIVLQAFDARLKESITLKGDKRPTSYRYLIRKEAYKLQKHLLEAIPYQPYVASQ